MKIRLSKYLFLLFFGSITTFFSCTEVEQESVILTEGVLFLSGERVRLSGRIYSNGGSDVSEHGFEISTSVNFSDPILIQNGVRTTLGAFIGESTQLDSDIEYYYRAYAIINNIFYYGDSKSFLTLNPTLISYSPQSASVNTLIEISGTNFSSKTKVYFGDKEAEIISIELESTIIVKVPEIKDQTEVTIKIADGSSELVFDNLFQYIYGIWEAKGDITNTFRFNEPLSFSVEGKFVFGLGRNLLDGTLNNTLWEYDITSESWSELFYPGSALIGAFSNNEGYFGSGYLGWDEGFNQNPILAFDLWKYENGVVNYVSALPFNLYKAVSFYYQEALYVTGGVNGKVQNFGLYKFSEELGSWERLEDVPIIINQNLPHFTYKNYQYFITSDGEIWRYDMVSGDWENKGISPFEIGTDGISEVIDEKVYLGLFSFDDKLWEYDIVNNTWKSKSNIDDGKSNFNAGSYVKNSQMGVIRLKPSGTDSEWIQTWEFDPEAY